MDKPLVTCLCLTKNRREWLPKAIECFLRQTYENRELVIVADEEQDYVGLVPEDPRVRVIHAPGVVGAKRNRGCEAARGELIAIWDDDDYSAPGRIEYQVGRMQSSAKDVVGWYSIKFTNGSKWWFYCGDASYAIATTMMFRKSRWERNRFNEIQCGQDEVFAMIANSERQLLSEREIGMVYATIHPNNTARKHPQGWKQLVGFVWADPVRAAA
jgi:glycosyltransferase involved in cell wall biosynthesis